MSGSIAPLIPIIMAAALFRTIGAILGPDILNILPSDSNLAILLDFVYDAGFYFFPIYLGYTAAKKLNTSTVLGMFIGGIMLASDFVAMVGTDVSFTVFGIPCALNNYSTTIMPILLSVWVMSYVHKFFSKYVPTVISTIFTPFLTILVMLPITLCALAPLGNFIGVYLAEFLNWFSSVGGGFAVGLMGAALRLKNKDDKALGLSCMLTGLLSGITEPTLYGIGIRYKRPFIGLAIGGLVGGLYAGFTHVTYHVMISILVLAPLSYTAGGTANMINGTIASVLAMIVSAVITYFFGFTKEDINGEESAAA